MLLAYDRYYEYSNREEEGSYKWVAKVFRRLRNVLDRRPVYGLMVFC